MDLDAVMRALGTGAREALGDDLLGLYLVGSHALGAADAHSDVAFLAITADRVSPDQLAALAGLHARLPDLPGHHARHLEGSYAPASDLRSPMTVGRSWPYVDDGARELVFSDHDNTLHSRWVLRGRAVAMVGLPASAYVAPIDVGALRAEMIGVARTRAEELEEHPEYLANGWYQSQLVVTLCRALYTAYTGEVIGKAAAAEWALEVVAREHCQVIRKAQMAEPNPRVRAQQLADPELAAPTRAFAWEVHRMVGAQALRPGSQHP